MNSKNITQFLKGFQLKNLNITKLLVKKFYLKKLMEFEKF